MDHATLRDRVARALPALEPLQDENWYGAWGRAHKFPVPREELPVPALPRVALHLLGCRNLGRGEKLAWEFVFRFEGHRCALALQKFGLRFYVDLDAVPDATAAAAITSRFVRSMQRAQRVLERDWLRDLADQQIDARHVTVVNQQHRLRQMYEYFYEGAELAFAGKGRMPLRPPGGGFWLAREAIEGFYNTVAMVAAYFSWLEHVMVLALPFAGYDPDAVPLKAFIGDRWGKKFKTLWPLAQDPAAKQHYDALHRIAEEYRNTYGHGGFDKPGATLHFHLPDVGALPAVLSDIRDAPQFGFVPVQADELSRVKAVFEGVDSWLDTQGAPSAMEWLRSGYDVRFDPVFRAEAAATMVDPDAFQDMLARHGYAIDQATNMDW